MIKSVEEIVDITLSKNTPDRMAYRYLIKQVDHLLRSRALDQQFDAMFEVPAIVLFQPHFNRAYVSQKILTHYIKRGFECEKEGFMIKLRWGKVKCDSDLDSESSSTSSGSDSSGTSSEEDEKLPPPRTIVVDSASSLVSRVASMKKSSL